MCAVFHHGGQLSARQKCPWVDCTLQRPRKEGMQLHVLVQVPRAHGLPMQHLIVCSEPLVKTKWTTLAGVRILDSDRAVSLPAATSDSCGVCRQGDSRGPLLRCSQCAALHHHSCCDPPVKSTVKSDADWICDSCRKCSGCGCVASIAGLCLTVHGYRCKTTQPPGVRWDALSHRGRLNLLFCAACRAKYDAKDICVTCGLPWSTIEGNGVFCDSCQVPAAVSGVAFRLSVLVGAGMVAFSV